MSFSPPKNIPSFNDSQRALENVYWSYSKGDGTALPMYKDKPYNYTSSRYRSIWRKKRYQGAALALLVVVIWALLRRQGSSSLFAFEWFQTSSSSRIDWGIRADDVRNAFQLSWDGYEKHLWGDNAYRPISNEGASSDSNNLESFIVGSLDSLIIMNLTSRLFKSREWLSGSVDFARGNANTFHATTQVLGGLLSAHYLTTEVPDLGPIPEEGEPGEDLYIEKATDLADRLLGAFDSPNGIPYTNINLDSLKPSGSNTTAAQAGGMQLEFRYITNLLGEKLFWDAAEKIAAFMASATADGFVPLGVTSDPGLAFERSTPQLNRDSIGYYDYLLKQFLQTSRQEPIYDELWSETLSGIKRHLSTYSKKSHFTMLETTSSETNAPLDLFTEEAICQIPGDLALSATGGRTLTQAKLSRGWNRDRDNEITLAKELMRSCWATFGWKSSSSKGTANWKSNTSVAKYFEDHTQSPALIESLFYLWRILEDEYFRELAWDLWVSYVNQTSVVSLDDMAGQSTQRDMLNGLWLSRTVKYFYLIFSPTNLLPLDRVVFTSAGHVLPRFKLHRGLKTGWKRESEAQSQPGVAAMPATVKMDAKNVENPDTK